MSINIRTVSGKVGYMVTFAWLKLDEGNGAI